MFVTADINTLKWEWVNLLCFSHNIFSLTFLLFQFSHKYTVYNQSIYFKHLFFSTVKWFQLLFESCSVEFCVVEFSLLYFFRLMQMYSCSYKYVITAFSWYNSLFCSKHQENQFVIDSDRCLTSLIMNIDLEQKVDEFIWKHWEISKKFVLYITIWSVLIWMWC